MRYQKRLEQLKIWILVIFALLGLSTAAVVVSVVLLCQGVSQNRPWVLGIVALVCFFLTIGFSLLIVQLFANRKLLLRHHAWLNTLFGEQFDVTIWDEDTFFDTVGSKSIHNRHNMVSYGGILYLHGFNNQPLFSFRLVDMQELNRICVEAVRKELQDKPNWNYAVNGQGDFLFYAEVSNANDFYASLRKIADDINAVLAGRPSLPMAFVMLGATPYQKEQTPSQNFERASIAARFHAANRPSGDLQLYAESMKQASLSDREQSADIEEGLKRNQFIIYYQAKWDVKKKCFYGAEALIRWRHPRRGFLPPSVFVPYAEASGQIVAIDHYVFEAVCRDIASWRDTRQRPLVISVNLSRRTVYDPGLIAFFAETIKKYKIDPHQIEIELTESLAAQDANFISFVIRKIKALGLSTSIDDFGIGYSSLSVLKNIDFDVLKLDKSFIDDIELSKESEDLVASIIYLVHGLHMRVIAEGVENPKQVSLLSAHDLDAIQGYYFAKPLDKANFEALLAHNPFEGTNPKGGKEE